MFRYLYCNLKPEGLTDFVHTWWQPAGVYFKERFKSQLNPWYVRGVLHLSILVKFAFSSDLWFLRYKKTNLSHLQSTMNFEQAQETSLPHTYLFFFFLQSIFSSINSCTGNVHTWEACSFKNFTFHVGNSYSLFHTPILTVGEILQPITEADHMSRQWPYV